MNLNNRGWGVFQMVWMTGIIVFFFLLMIILICRLYAARGIDLHGKDVITERNHEQMIEDLSLAAERYIKYNYANIRNVKRIRLSSDKLYQAGLFAKDLYSGCKGYVIASKNNNSIETKPYIKCSNYSSPGYDKN